jgi:hypothetical protein
MKTKLIIFSNNFENESSYFGFKLFPANVANQYLKCVELLSNNR